jgi:hypothetical protein
MSRFKYVEVIENIAEAIRDYITRNPSAADTAKGIAGWWLSPEYKYYGIDYIQQALDKLENESFLVKQCLPGGSVIYRRPNAN